MYYEFEPSYQRLIKMHQNQKIALITCMLLYLIIYQNVELNYLLKISHWYNQFKPDNVKRSILAHPTIVNDLNLISMTLKAIEFIYSS